MSVSTFALGYPHPDYSGGTFPPGGGDRCACGGVRHWHAKPPYGCDDCECTEFTAAPMANGRGGLMYHCTTCGTLTYFQPPTLPCLGSLREAHATIERLTRIIDGYDRTPAEQRATEAEAEVERLRAENAREANERLNARDSGGLTVCRNLGCMVVFHATDKCPACNDEPANPTELAGDEQL